MKPLKSSGKTIWRLESSSTTMRNFCSNAIIVQMKRNARISLLNVELLSLDLFVYYLSIKANLLWVWKPLAWVLQFPLFSPSFHMLFLCSLPSWLFEPHWLLLFSWLHFDSCYSRPIGLAWERHQDKKPAKLRQKGLSQDDIGGM